MTTHAFNGVLVPAITPMNADLSPNPELFVTHCKWLLGEGAGGLAPFGTTSEATSNHQRDLAMGWLNVDVRVEFHPAEDRHRGIVYFMRF